MTDDLKPTFAPAELAIPLITPALAVPAAATVPPTDATALAHGAPPMTDSSDGDEAPQTYATDSLRSLYQQNKRAIRAAAHAATFNSELSRKTRRRNRLNELAMNKRAAAHKECLAAASPSEPACSVNIRTLSIKSPTPPATGKRKTHRMTAYPVWEHLPMENKVVWYQAAISTQKSLFTLNLSDELINELLVMKKGRGFARQLQERIARAFRDAGKKFHLNADPGFWFAVDVNEKGRFHLHGGVDLPENFFDAFEDVLRKAGGVVPTKERCRQLLIKPINPAVGGGAGWAGYSVKVLAVVREKIGHQVTGCSRSVNQEARRLYDVARAASRLDVKPHALH